MKGDAEIRAPASHEVDAITATLTAYLHLQGKTRKVGDKEKGHIVIPKGSHWRQLKIE